MPMLSQKNLGHHKMQLAYKLISCRVETLNKVKKQLKITNCTTAIFQL